MKKVIVFIPCFNEQETIGKVIDRLRDIYPLEATRLKDYYIELLVINDGSRDKTEQIVIEKGVKVISSFRNLGLGAATRTGMQAAYEMGADIAVKFDADFQHSSEDIEKVIMPIIENKADICWGSRFTGKIHYRMPWLRFLGNKAFTLLMNMLTDYKISDAQTGLMAYSKKYLSVFEIHGNYNPPQQLLIDAYVKHMRYFEVPVEFHSRKTGKSFVSLKYPFCVIGNIFRILVFANPLKVFSFLGLSLISFSVGYSILAILARKFEWGLPFLFIPNLPLAAMLAGIQCFFFGILADLIIYKKK